MVGCGAASGVRKWTIHGWAKAFLVDLGLSWGRWLGDYHVYEVGRLWCGVCASSGVATVVVDGAGVEAEPSVGKGKE